ncbi:MAG: undecaprenyl-diphosphate phosphatase [Planctomycetes bacterium]|nr:undecaprenyl-diphosphate phosphatase [Planctomycetota bacterium]
MLLGVIQGLTEFLPVSSSGHLMLCEKLLGLDAEQARGATVEVALHAGTLLAVLVFLRADLLLLARALFLPARVPLAARRPALRLLASLGIATLPAAVLGLLFQDAIEGLFSMPWAVGCGFLVTGLLLVLSGRCAAGRRGAADGGLWRAFLIGCAQAVAMVPGISRSGSTIVAAMALGMRGPEAGRFSFLLAVPVVSGAALLKAGEIASGPPAQTAALLAGALAAFLSGLAALSLLSLLLRRGRLSVFAWYVFPLALAALFAAART